MNESRYSNTESPDSMETERLILDHVPSLRVPAGWSAEEALADLKTRIAEQEGKDHGPKKKICGLFTGYAE